MPPPGATAHRPSSRCAQAVWGRLDCHNLSGGLSRFPSYTSDHAVSDLSIPYAGAYSEAEGRCTAGAYDFHHLPAAGVTARLAATGHARTGHRPGDSRQGSIVRVVQPTR